MGVIAIGGMAAVGALSGFMGAQAEKQQAEANYLANKIEVERNNFQQNLANDKQNFQAARANAMRKWNNKEIAKSATKTYADMKFQSREAFKARSQSLANNQIAMNAALTTEATGKNLRGGMVERMEMMSREQAKQHRLNNRKQKFSEDLSNSVSFEAMLNKRDLRGYNDASIFIPGSTGVAPGNNNLGMLTAILGGGASGASQGIGMASGIKNLRG